jgi:dihydroneopterin aldolase
MIVQTVALHDVKCFAYHGYYPEEQLTGTHFLVSISVDFIHQGDTENLQHTINYEILNDIILKEMTKTQKMLETVVKSMLNKVVECFPFVTSSVVGIKKLHPPMVGEVGHSYVQLKYTADV